MHRFRRLWVRALAAVVCWLAVSVTVPADGLAEQSAQELSQSFTDGLGQGPTDAPVESSAEMPTDGSSESPAATLTLETERLQLHWANGSAELMDWRVRAGDSQWVSLVTRDESSRLLSRHLHLEGSQSVVPQLWRPVRVAGGVAFRGTSSDGRVRFRQRVTPADGEYRLRYRLELENVSGTDWQPGDEETIRIRLGPGLGEYPTAGYGVAETLYSFVEPVVSVDDEVRPVSLQSAADERTIPFNESSVTDWAGLHSRYFALVIAPGEEGAISAVELELPAGESPDEEATSLPLRYLPAVVLKMPMPTLAPGESAVREFAIFSGPKSRTALTGGEIDLGALSFAGLWIWLRELCIGLLWLLGIIYVVVPNWGLAIIVLAVLVRLLLYPVAKRALASQHAFTEVQKKIQPELRHIKYAYRGEEQSERILALYERHGVSPLAGLKPLLIVLIQIPVFIALFHVLGQAYELRGTSFLWIDSLAEPDRLFSFGVAVPYFGSHFNLLPILLAVTTLMTIKLAPAPAADARARIWQNAFLALMAIGFLVLFYPFPSGMVLYWTVANLLHLAQQYVVERS